MESDTDSTQGPSSSSSFPRFLIIESTKVDEPLTKLSPFVIEKVLVSVAGSPKSVKKLNSGSLLVEVEKPKHADNLMKLSRFFEIPAKCYPHTSLNTSRGIIRCPDLAGVTEEEIFFSNLATQNVTAARRITVFRDNVKRSTNTIVLTLSTSILPKFLKVGYLKVPVDIYIPNPLQCYACFKYGHHEKKCRLYGGDELCRRCGVTGVTHDESRCTNDVKCVNCGEDHPSTSTSCKIWKREKEIVTIKYREGLSFPEARKIVEARYNLSYSTVLKSNKSSSIQLKDAQTQTTDVTTQTSTPQKQTTSSAKPTPKPQGNKKPEKTDKNVPKSPTTSPRKVLSDRLPKGSDDQIQQHNRFQCLDEEDMDADINHAEPINPNKQGRIIKLNNKKRIDTYFHGFIIYFLL